RDFYPGRRIVLSFMSHTYSRTGALMDDFARACARADLVILHEIYASARETALPGVSGQQLAALTAKLNPQTHYFPDPEDAATEVLGLLQPGDIFLTMGAGDNWKLGRAVLTALEARQ